MNDRIVNEKVWDSGIFSEKRFQWSPLETHWWPLTEVQEWEHFFQEG
jgi:hypothetical protein